MPYHENLKSGVDRRTFLAGLAAATLASGWLLSGDESSARPNSIGIAFGDSLFGLPDDELFRRLALVKKLGGTTIRFDYDGDRAGVGETADYDWSSIDPIMNAAAQFGFGVLATISFTTPRDRMRQCRSDYSCQPRDPHDLALFANAAVMRYSIYDIPKLKCSVWNEENIQPGGPTPGKYIDLYDAVYESIKSANSDIPVLVGGLAASKSDGSSMSPVVFLRALYDAGLITFDGMELHPYSYPLLPEEADETNAFTQIEGSPRVPELYGNTIFDVLDEHGDGDKELSLSELGAPTNGTGATSTSSNPFPINWNYNTSYVSLHRQALTVGQSLTHHFRRANVTDRLIDTLYDLPGYPSPQRSFGLFFSDGRPKPAARTFRRVALVA